MGEASKELLSIRQWAVIRELDGHATESTSFTHILHLEKPPQIAGERCRAIEREIPPIHALFDSNFYDDRLFIQFLPTVRTSEVERMLDARHTSERAAFENTFERHVSLSLHAELESCILSACLNTNDTETESIALVGGEDLRHSLMIVPHALLLRSPGVQHIARS